MEDRILDNNQILRYSKQIILDDFGTDGQEKLRKAKVLVIGAGGLGSPALLYLAGAGIGTLGIVDFDTVGISNLNRQILYTTEDIGKKKVDCAAEYLKKLNPEVKIVKYPFRLNIDNIEEVIAEYDVILDCVDNFPARFLISDCCYFMKKPLIEGAAVRYEGIMMTIIPDQSACYRCLYPMPPADGVIQTCSDTGILGMVTGTIGSLQALEAVKVIIGKGETLSGRILTFEAFEMNFREIDWKRKESCPLCGKAPTVKELVQYEIKCKMKTV